MKLTGFTPVLLASSVSGAVLNITPQATACEDRVSLTTNPFSQRTLHPNSVYRSKVLTAAASIADPTLKAKALKAADVGTFLWLNSTQIQQSDSLLEKELKEVPCGNVLGFVIEALPIRGYGCSIGTPPVMDLEGYKRGIDAVAKLIESYPNVATVAIIEPGVLQTIYEYWKISACAQRDQSYKEGIAYALRKLNTPNVMTYIDAASGNTFCWKGEENIAPDLIAQIYTDASKPSQFRGFSTNVANYNSFSMHPGEFEGDYEPPVNRCANEQTYVNNLSKALATRGIPGHAIMDTSRSGIQGLRLKRAEWCNVNGAGFGYRPSSNTGMETLDAFVWGKNGGVSDGTTNVEMWEYESACGVKTAFAPSPERGAWNQAYFEMLLENAHPTF